MPAPPYSVQLTRACAEATALTTAQGGAPGSAQLLVCLLGGPSQAAKLLRRRELDPAWLRAAADDASLHEPAATLTQLLRRAGDVAASGGAVEVGTLHFLVALSRLPEAAGARILQQAGQDLVALRNDALALLTGAAPRRFLGRVDAAQTCHAHPYRDQMVALGGPRRAQHIVATPSKRPTRNASTQPAPSLPAPLLPAPFPPPAAPSKAPERKGGAGELAHGPDQAMDTGDRPQADDVACRARERDDDETAAPTPPPADVNKADATGDVTQARLADIAPVLAECSVDLTARALAGHLDPTVGRDKELEALADVLGKRRANNPVLVGPPGVGKTAIVEGLALAWSEACPDDGLPYDNRRIVALDTGAMVAGTSLRGSFAERMVAIKAEVAAAGGHLVVFIDELHTLMGAGASGEGPQDAAGELKTALARGEFPCIGATTVDEYKRYIERDPALERRFTAIEVAEPSPEDAVAILRGAIGPYQTHHGVQFGDDAIEAAVALTHRFVTERKLPDKAFAALDLAGSRAHRRGKVQVQREEVAAVVHAWTGVPMERLVETEASRFARAETHLAERLVGHPHVISAVAQAVRRGFAGFNGKRPMGSFLFLGPTGVGKTEMVKVLAEFVFGHKDAIVRFDMSELSEKHAVARLLGAQPGYIGYEEGGQLTEALRKRPFQIVLFDEVEKAHPDVVNVLLQVLDEGHLTDAQGRRISFTNTFVIMTSNLGAEALERGSAIGFEAEKSLATKRHLRGAQAPAVKGMQAQDQDQDQDRDQDQARMAQVREAARACLTPELWSRIDAHLVFLPLSYAEIERIADAQLKAQAQALERERGIRLRWSSAVLPFLLRQGGYSPTTGARGLRQALQRHVEAPIAELVLSQALGAKASVHLDVRSGDKQLRLRIFGTGARRRPTPG